MKKFIIVLTVICVVWTFFALQVYATGSYSGVSHELTKANWFGYRKETMTVNNLENEHIWVKGTVRVYVNNSFASGAYLNDYKLKVGKSVTISSQSHTNTNYGRFNYIITSNSGNKWGDSGYDW